MNKLAILSFAFISTFNLGMELREVDSQSKVLSLREQCLNAVIKGIDNPKCDPQSCTGLPKDLAESLLEKCKEQALDSILISQLPGPGKISPDGSKVLISPDKESLKIYSIATGIEPATLEDSITSDNKSHSFVSNSRIRFQWGTTGKYIHAVYFTPQEDHSKSGTYITKVWDSNTGKKLYQILSGACCKLYFAPTDKYLLKKAVDKPLEVYDAETGNHVINLGKPTYQHSRTPQDPLGQWVISYDKENTYFHEASKLALIKSLPGCIKCWSQDGSLAAIEVEETSENVKSYTSIYNRLFQRLIKISVEWYTSRMAISPCNQFLIHYNSDHQYHYSIKTGLRIKEYEHSISTDNNLPLVFPTITGDSTINLIKNGQKTEILVEKEKSTQKIICPQQLNTLFYTKNSNIVGLAYYSTILYFLNLKNGTLTPCSIKLSTGIFGYKPTKHLSQNGHFVTKNGDQYELRQLLSNEKLTTLITALTQKLENTKL